MYVTWQLIISICVGFSSICLSVGYLIKIYKGLRKPSETMKGNINKNKTEIDSNRTEIEDLKDEIAEMKKTLEYLENAINLTIRTQFTVLGELAVNNDASGHCKAAQDEIQKFLTPVNPVK